jgi:uncharacterized phiE125 gp8 family phage protein
MTRNSYALITGPTSEPITLAEAQAQARITGPDSDTLITSYIAVARQRAEQVLAFGLFTQTWRYDLDEFDEVIPLPMARKLQSITHVKYYDVNGTLQTLAATEYELDTTRMPACLVRASDVSWPPLQADRRVGKVQITYVVGWATVADIPEIIKQGIRLYVGYLDADRDGMAVKADAAQMAAERCWLDRMYYLPTIGNRVLEN